MTLETLLEPVSPTQPCGENLEYDAEFQALEQASQGKAEQQFGDTIIPAEPADWTRLKSSPPPCCHAPKICASCWR
jgi:type VI secretion system protein ImpA